MVATNSHQAEIVAALLAHPKTNVNAASEIGNTALMSAALHNNVEIVQLLLAAPGIDVLVRNRNAKSALELATKEHIKALISALSVAK
eukprot:gene13467-15504_t